jgi:hypothetical protein
MSAGPVLASGVVGSVTGLTLMGLGGVLVAVVVAGANIWLRWQRVRNKPQSIPPNTVEASPMYRRYLVAAAWAGGSPRNWDHSVRPVLGELVELAMAERNPHGGDPRAAARELLGPQLYSLVDRDATRSEDREGPGPGRDALVEILKRVEKA